MNIEVAREALVAELALARRLGERRATIPVYSYAKLDADFGEVRIQVTDGESALETGCAATVHSTGSVLVPVKALHEMARNGTAETVRLALDGARVTVAIGGFRSRLGTLSVEDFPAPPTWPEDQRVALPLAAVAAAIERTRFVVESPSAKTQGYMNGALVSTDGGKLTVVATDGRRLALASAPCGQTAAMPALLPRKALEDLAALLAADGTADEIGYAVDGSRAFFEVGLRRYATQLLDVQFPNYQRIVPNGSANAADVDRDLWLGALRRVSLVGTETSRKVKLALDPAGSLTASLTSHEIGEAVEALPAVVTGGGWEAYFDAGYVMDFLSAVGGTVRFEQADPMRAGKFLSSGGVVDCLYVCMPMTA